MQRKRSKRHSFTSALILEILSLLAIVAVAQPNLVLDALGKRTASPVRQPPARQPVVPLEQESSAPSLFTRWPTAAIQSPLVPEHPIDSKQFPNSLPTERPLDLNANARIATYSQYPRGTQAVIVQPPNSLPTPWSTPATNFQHLPPGQLRF